MFNMDTCLSVIAEYEMNLEEATAYKLCCLYHDAARKVFPDYRHYRMSKSDPRKTSLFKYCYKLLNETRGKLKMHEYPLYMRAQMDVLKAITKDGNPPLIQPAIVAGPKAWTRWEIWKRHYDKLVRKFSEAEQIENIDHVKVALTQTKNFLKARMGEINKEKVEESLAKRDMFLWVGRGQVSPYFFLLSPTISKWLQAKKLDHLSAVHLDLDYYKKSINSQVESYFKENFAYEME